MSGVAIPDRLEGLPRDHADRVVPWFVAWPDGRPDHRIVRAEAPAHAVQANLCWLCGQPNEELLAFVVGPMCVVNRLSAEPPMHHGCAAYAIGACPFLSRPHMRRREAGIPEGAEEPGGVMLRRNPGVVALWSTTRFTVEPAPQLLFRMGDPLEVEWFTQGRRAERMEALVALESGLPSLRELAAQEGVDAQFQLHLQVATARALLPAEHAEAVLA